MQYWHAIYSTPNGEGRACLGIEAAGYKAFYPVERLRYRLHRQTEATGIFIKSLFPRYLFAQFDAGRDHGAILEIDGVHEVLRQGNSILRVPEMAIEAMRHAQEVGMFDRSRRGSAFVP